MDCDSNGKSALPPWPSCRCWGLNFKLPSSVERFLSVRCFCVCIACAYGKQYLIAASNGRGSSPWLLHVQRISPRERFSGKVFLLVWRDVLLGGMSLAFPKWRRLKMSSSVSIITISCCCSRAAFVFKKIIR